jgi:hypothetical protein
MGPQCISLFNTAGNHVIRYNECYCDLTNGRVPPGQEAHGVRGEPVYAPPRRRIQLRDEDRPGTGHGRPPARRSSVAIRCRGETAVTTLAEPGSSTIHIQRTAIRRKYAKEPS